MLCAQVAIQGFPDWTTTLAVLARAPVSFIMQVRIYPLDLEEEGLVEKP